jgi:hypothetical protein
MGLGPQPGTDGPLGAGPVMTELLGPQPPQAGRLAEWEGRSQGHGHVVLQSWPTTASRWFVNSDGTDRTSRQCFVTTTATSPSDDPAVVAAVRGDDR